MLSAMPSNRSHASSEQRQNKSYLSGDPPGTSVELWTFCKFFEFIGHSFQVV